MKFDVVAEVEKKKDLLIETADYIWDHPELGFKEFQCAQKLQEVLRAEGFQLETGLGHITTAFSGRFGSGRPVIGILGEFDALMNLSQKAGVTHQESAGASVVTAVGITCSASVLSERRLPSKPIWKRPVHLAR